MNKQNLMMNLVMNTYMQTHIQPQLIAVMLLIINQKHDRNAIRGTVIQEEYQYLIWLLIKLFLGMNTFFSDNSIIM